MKKQLYFAAVLTTFMFDATDALPLEHGTLLKPSSNSIIYTLHVEKGIELSAHYTKQEFELLKKKITLFTHIDRSYLAPYAYPLMDEIRALINQPKSNPFLAIVKLEKLLYGYDIELKEALSQDPISYNDPISLKTYIENRLATILETLERSISYKPHLDQTKKWRIQNNFKALRELSTIPSIQQQLDELQSTMSDSFYGDFYKLQGALVSAQAELWWRFAHILEAKVSSPSLEEITTFMHSIRNKHTMHPFPFAKYNFAMYHALFKNLLNSSLLRRDVEDNNSFNYLEFPGKYSLKQTETLEWDLTLLENCIELLKDISARENDKPLTLAGNTLEAWNEVDRFEAISITFSAYNKGELIREESYRIENNEKLLELKNNVQTMIDKLSDNSPHKEIKEIKDTFYNNPFASIPVVLQMLNWTFPIKQCNDIEVYKVMKAESFLDYLIEYYQELHERLFRN